MLKQNTSLVLAGLAVSCVTIYAVKKLRRNRKLPPGPSGVPLLGILPFISTENLPEAALEFCRKYGDIISFYIGTRLYVVVNNHDLIKEMLSQPVFSGRINNSIFDNITGGGGVLFSEGQTWQFQRRLTLHVLRDMGFAKENSYKVTLDEAERIYRTLEAASASGEGIETLNMFRKATSSVISSMVFAERPADSDKEFTKITEAIASFGDDVTFFSPPFSFPFINKFSWLISLTPSAQAIRRVLTGIRGFMQVKIDARKEVIKEGEEAQCLVDSYVQAYRKAQQDADPNVNMYNDEQLTQVCFELFVGGTDTTSRSLEWLMVYLAVHEQVQEKLFQEIKDVIGTERPLLMTDREKLHYTKSVIEETFRMATLDPFGFFHRALEDTEFHGFLIPSDAIIFPFSFGAHRDEGYWKDAKTYRPERFLNSEGKFTQERRVQTFSTGRRACLGESLARLEIFVILVRIIQKFQVHLHPEYKQKEDEILQGKFRVQRSPGDNKLTFHMR